MSDYTRHEMVLKRTTFALPSPTNAAEFGKAYSAAKDLATQRGVDVSYDDWLTVEASDGEIVLHFTTESPDGAE